VRHGWAVETGVSVRHSRVLTRDTESRTLNRGLSPFQLGAVSVAAAGTYPFKQLSRLMEFAFGRPETSKADCSARLAKGRHRNRWTIKAGGPNRGALTRLSNTPFA